VSQQTISVAVHLAGNDYRFACSPAEREELLEAVAMMAALNLSHELLRQQRQAAEMDVLLNHRMRDLLQKVDGALSQAAATEL
jgi:cell division protein ZapA